MPLMWAPLGDTVPRPICPKCPIPTSPRLIVGLGLTWVDNPHAFPRLTLAVPGVGAGLASWGGGCAIHTPLCGLHNTLPDLALDPGLLTAPTLCRMDPEPPEFAEATGREGALSPTVRRWRASRPHYP